MSICDRATDDLIADSLAKVRGEKIEAHNAAIEACVKILDSQRFFANCAEHLNCIAALRKLKVETDHA